MSTTNAFISGLIDSPTGAKLHCYSMKSNVRKKKKGVVHINHGMAEYAARYERFAAALAGSGYHVYAHDHRGHGKTTAPDAPLGTFSSSNGWLKVIDDVRSVNDYIRQQHPDLPVIYFGHSMGSIIGLNYCIRYSDTIEGAALWNSGVDAGALLFIYSLLLKIERMFKGSDVPSTIATKLTFEDWNKKFAPNRTNFDWLSRDEVEVDKYAADPLCGFPATTGLWLDLLEGIRTGADDNQLGRIRGDLPMNLLGGGADPCSDNGKGVERLSARLRTIGLSDLTCNVLEGTRHESLNEINRDETTAQFIKWLDERFGG